MADEFMGALIESQAQLKQAEHQVDEARIRRNRVVKAARDEGFTLESIGNVLGVSKQAVAVMAREPKEQQ